MFEYRDWMTRAFCDFILVQMIGLHVFPVSSSFERSPSDSARSGRMSTQRISKNLSPELPSYENGTVGHINYMQSPGISQKIVFR